jgi:hypothetical protein
MTDRARLHRRRSAQLVVALVVCGCAGSGGGAKGTGGAGGQSGSSMSQGGSGGGAGTQEVDAGGSAGASGAPDAARDEGKDESSGDAVRDGSTPILDSAATDADATPSSGVPTFVAVGYGGVRVRSLDLGKTWIDAQRLGGGGDDNYLLRTIAFGKGLFVALGWQLHTSPDGKTWTMRAKDAGQWMGGVRFGNGMFVAAGGYGESTYSMDGLTWPKGGGRMTDAARSVAFGNGLWVARADSNHWWQTSTGQTWTDMGGAHMDDVVYCGNQFVDSKTCASPVGRDGGRVAFGENVWVGIKDGKIERSEDGGTTWKVVYTASDALEDVAFGDVAP